MSDCNKFFPLTWFLLQSGQNHYFYSLMDSDGFNRLAGALRSEIKKGLPGSKAQWRMAPKQRQGPGTKGSGGRDAGVLILLYPAGEKICMVLIRRTDYPGVHSGQVSFPGGKFEPEDRNLEYTSIRESEEELGIGLGDIEVLGNLTSLYIHVSDITVYPLLGRLPYRPVFDPDPVEVNRVIEVPVGKLVRPGIVSQMQHESQPVLVPYYNLEGNRVWGATAMILSEFIELIRRSRSPADPGRG